MISWPSDGKQREPGGAMSMDVEAGRGIWGIGCKSLWIKLLAGAAEAKKTCKRTLTAP